jgi:anti-sigma B factor antagonist
VERFSGAAPPSQSGGSDQDKRPLLTVRVEDCAEGSIVALAGELDLSTVPRMEGPLLEQITQRHAVLVDLSKLSFIDSSGIGVLMQARRSANGTPMHVLIRPGSQVERVFQIAAVSEALPVFTERGRALAELAGRRDERGRSAGG